MASGICKCGCGLPTKRIKWSNKNRGEVRGEYRKFIAGHTRKKLYAFILQDRGFKSPCWIWMRHINSHGYALVSQLATIRGTGGRSRYAHRIYYEWLIGPVPQGMELDHLCRVRCCVNPNHLEPVTKKENAQRGLNTKLTTSQISEMFALKKQGIKVRFIAERYGISKSYLEALCQRNKVWVTK